MLQSNVIWSEKCRNCQRLVNHMCRPQIQANVPLKLHQGNSSILWFHKKGLKQTQIKSKQSPSKNIKDVQSLTRRVATLNRFVSKVTNKCLPFFRVLRKAFEWTDECQQVFKDLKAYLTSTLLLSPSKLEEELYLYLAVSPHAVSSTLIKEEGKV